PYRRVRGAESPCLHDALAGDKLDLTALDPAAEEGECLTLAVAELRRHAGGRGELLAVGQHLVDGLGGGGNDGFLVNEHGVSLCSAGRMPALSSRRTEVPQTDTSGDEVGRGVGAVRGFLADRTRRSTVTHAG